MHPFPSSQRDRRPPTVATALNKMPVEVQRKLTVLGFPGVGKSSLTTCFVENRFVENYDPTIENTFHKTIRFRNAHFVTDIVDTAGMVRVLQYAEDLFVVGCTLWLCCCVCLAQASELTANQMRTVASGRDTTSVTAKIVARTSLTSLSFVFM